MLASLALLAAIGAPHTAAAGQTDPFLCYKVKKSRGGEKFSKVFGLELTDSFETGAFDVKKPRSLCLPADVDANPALDTATHLVSYRVKPVKGSPRHQRVNDFRVATELGVVFLDTVKADSLLLPSAKDLNNVTAPLDGAAHGVDHFKCYKVRKPKGFKKIAGVGIADQFAQGKDYELKKPSRLCLPVDQAGQGVKDPTSHLLCYKAKPSEKA